MPILDHDLEVRSTYTALLPSRRPKVFFDVWVNWNQHSPLFLVHGVPIVSCEPNLSCYVTYAAYSNTISWFATVQAFRSFRRKNRTDLCSLTGRYSWEPGMRMCGRLGADFWLTSSLVEQAEIQRSS